MRILPDTRDLINLTEHSRTVTPEAFGEYLLAGNHQIVLSMTNIRELSGPLANGGDFLRIRALLQLLEGLSHTYLREAAIIELEIKSALDAFNAGAAYQQCAVYVTRWDQTLLSLPGQQGGPADALVSLRLDEIVYMIRQARPDVFAPPHHYLPRLQQDFREQRAALRAGQLPKTRDHFVGSLRRFAERRNITLPNGREEEFGRWVFADVSRCPGIRLHHETYRKLLSNCDDIPEVGDFSDLATIFAVPYVDAATLDNRMRGYCDQASGHLFKLGLPLDYRQRLYSDLSALIDSNP